MKKYIVKDKCKLKLAQEIKSVTDLEILKSIQIVNSIIENPFIILDEIIQQLLEYSSNVIVEKIIDEEEGVLEYIDGVFTNPLGLTESEIWYNSLTIEEKQHVINLSSFFNPPVSC